jgi:hypothetical protein
LDVDTTVSCEYLSGVVFSDRLWLPSSLPFVYCLSYCTAFCAYCTMFTTLLQLIFDEEFIGGKGLQGSCSQFRGRLAPWTDLLLVSRTTEYQDFKKAGGKAGATGAGVAPHQVKKVLQKGHEGASAPTHASTAGVKPSYAKAAHAAPTAPVMAPAVLTQAHANAGAKLLKALQKEDHQKGSTAKAAPHGTGTHAAHAAPHAPSTTAMLSPASKVTILKKKIGIVDKPATTASSAGGASNGTGKNILAEAAGFSATDLGSDASLLPAYETLQQHALMAGVISYQAQQATALHKSSLTAAPVLPPPPHVGHHATGAHGVHPPRPPTAHTVPHHTPHATAHQPQQKLVLNKDATRRIVTHELKPNASADAAHKPTAGAEKKPAAAAKKTAHAAAHDTTTTAAADAGTTAPAQEASAAPAPADSAPAATTGAALLAKLKKHAPKNAATAAGSEGHKASAAEASAHKADTHPLGATPAHEVTAHAPPAPHAPRAPGAHTTTAKPLTMAEKLANAKRVMKEKQEQQMAHTKAHGDGAHGHHEAGAADSNAHAHGHTAHAADAGAAAHAAHAQGTTAATHAAPSHATSAAHKDKAAHQAPTQKTDKPKGANIVSILTKAKAESAAKVDNTPASAVTEPASGAQEEAKAPATTAPANTAATAGKNIKQLLLNAKRTTAAPSTDTVAPTAADASASSRAAQAEGEAAKSPTQGTAAPKKKVAASLVPSKVLISKAK